MFKSALYAASLALILPTTAQAGTIDPDVILRELETSYPRNWDEGRAAWVNYAQDRDRRFRWQLQIEYGITSKGRMVNCTVLTSSGSDQFDNAACQALTRKARFDPKLNAIGKPVKSEGEVSYKLSQTFGGGWICATGMDEGDQ